MGSVVLSNTLSRLTGPNAPKLIGAICINCPLDFHKCYDTTLSKTCYGLYDWSLFNNYGALYIKNENELKNEIKEKCGIEDIKKVIEALPKGERTLKKLDSLITAPLNGFESVDE